jgi:hypothetical protein
MYLFIVHDCYLYNNNNNNRDSAQCASLANLTHDVNEANDEEKPETEKRANILADVLYMRRQTPSRT